MADRACMNRRGGELHVANPQCDGDIATSYANIGMRDADLQAAFARHGIAALAAAITQVKLCTACASAYFRHGGMLPEFKGRPAFLGGL